MNEEEIKSFILDRCSFKYKSYDHKKAVEYCIGLNPDYFHFYGTNKKSWYIPDEIKGLFVVYRIGKLRSLKIDPNGKICGIVIGNKYYKTYKPYELGFDVKPILLPDNDFYKLIERGLAIDFYNFETK
jgi:hypothetical protein